MQRTVVVCPNPDCPDLEASGVRGEYVSETSVCPYCGAGLVDPAWVEAQEREGKVRTPDHGDPELEPVFQSDDPAEIQIARSILDGAGIPSVTTNDSASDRILPGFDPFRFMRGARAAVFWVPVDLAEEARALLTEVAPDDDGDATSV